MNGQRFDIHAMLVLFNLVEVAAAQALLEGDVEDLAKLTPEKMRKRRQSPTCVSRIGESLEIPGSRQKGIYNDAGSRKKGTNNDVGSRKKGTNNYAGSREKREVCSKILGRDKQELVDDHRADRWSVRWAS